MSMLINHKTIWTPDNSFLLEYKERCECGEFIIGQDLAIELENLAEDLQNDPDTNRHLDRSKHYG